MFFYEPHDPEPPALEAVVVAGSHNVLEVFALDERFHDHSLVLLRDLPCADQAIQEGGGLRHDLLHLVVFTVTGGIGTVRLTFVCAVPFEGNECRVEDRGQQSPNPVSQLPDDPAGHFVWGDGAFPDDLDEEKAEVLDEVLPVDAGMPPPCMGVDARQRRCEKDNEERGDVAMPVVVPVAGNEIEEDGVLPIQVRRLVMEEGDQIAGIGKGEQLWAFRPQALIGPFESLGGKLFPVAGKR